MMFSVRALMPEFAQANAALEPNTPKLPTCYFNYTDTYDSI